MPTESRSSTSAKILYRPWGIASSIIGGVVAGRLFRTAYKKASPGSREDPPSAMQSEYSWQEVLLTAAAQGAVFAVVKATLHRGGARAFERWTGEWPGD